MPRAPFIHTVTIYRGPDHVDAGEVVDVLDCRVVLEDGIQEIEGQPIRAGWITLPPYDLSHGWTEAGEWNPFLADRLAAPDYEEDPTYQIWYADVINWKEQAEYYRLNIIPIIEGEPVEDLLPDGTGACGLRPTIELDKAYAFDGSTTFGYYQYPTGLSSGAKHVTVTVSGGTLSLFSGSYTTPPFSFCTDDIFPMSGGPCYQWTHGSGNPHVLITVASGTPVGTIIFSDGAC